jgi:general secretion pathway protein I
MTHALPAQWSSSRRERKLRVGTATNRRGLSLFEVVIALAIFMGALAAIGQLVSVGAQGAVRAKLESQAVIRCETTMAEVLAGYIGLRNTSGTFSDNPAWTWSVSVASTSHSGLYLIEVKATHTGQSNMSKVSYSLERFIRDPGVEMAAYEAQLAADQAKAENANSTTNSSGSTGSGK